MVVLKVFFCGKKGIRHGDPISPLLFVVTIFYLSRYLSANIPQSFRFHNSCKEVKLNHLCFADDLFLFSYGDTNSVGFLADALKHFEKYQGCKLMKVKAQFTFQVSMSKLERRFWRS